MSLPKSSADSKPGRAKDEDNMNPAQMVIDCCEEIKIKAAKLGVLPQSNLLDALHQRLDKYKSAAESAKAEGNGIKTRRMGRIIKQYDNAIKEVEAGKQVDLSELPTPPGFPPLPVGSQPIRTAPNGVPPVRLV